MTPQRTEAALPDLDSVARLPSNQALKMAIHPWRGQGARHAQTKIILLCADLLILVACFLLGRLPVWLGEHPPHLSVWESLLSGQGQVWMILFTSIGLGMVAWMAAVDGHYTAARRKPWSDELRQILLVVTTGAAANIVLNFMSDWPVSRIWLLVSWALVFVLLPLGRYGLRRYLLAKGWLTQPYVLVGDPKDVSMAAAALASEPLMGYTPVAVICREPHEHSVEVAGVKLTTMTLTDSVRKYLSKIGGYQVVVVLPEHNSRWLRDLVEQLMLTRDDITMIPAITGLPMLGMDASHFFSHEVLLLRPRNNLQRRIPKMVKRVLDVVGAIFLLVVLSPLFLVVSWRIWRADHGPVYFTQDRVGLKGQRFKFIKFRSMVMNADAALERWKTEQPELYAEYCANNFKLEKDPRITDVGRWIRRSSVDELPQLINVLRGDMSLVGPRPLLPRELEAYGDAIDAYGKARPGITGLWQVSGRSASTFEYRIAMDLWYVRNWSLWYDIVILFRTIGVVLRQEGAH